MFSSNNKNKLGGITRPNITPLADVTTTLIVVFLITMPSILWSGIQVNATEAEAGAPVVTKKMPAEDQPLTIAVRPDGVTLNRVPVTLANLGDLLSRRLDERSDKTVIVVPSEKVELGEVVSVLDVAKASGAGALALVNLEGDLP
jgi:biopolymer transport protein ExbD